MGRIILVILLFVTSIVSFSQKDNDLRELYLRRSGSPVEVGHQTRRLFDEKNYAVSNMTFEWRVEGSYSRKFIDTRFIMMGFEIRRKLNSSFFFGVSGHMGLGWIEDDIYDKSFAVFSSFLELSKYSRLTYGAHRIDLAYRYYIVPSTKIGIGGIFEYRYWPDSNLNTYRAEDLVKTAVIPYVEVGFRSALFVRSYFFNAFGDFTAMQSRATTRPTIKGPLPVIALSFNIAHYLPW